MPPDDYRTLKKAAARAMSLQERLSFGGPRTKPASNGVLQERLEFWSDLISDSSEKRFAVRLQWLGISERNRARLCPAIDVDASKISWIARFVEIIRARDLGADIQAPLDSLLSDHDVVAAAVPFLRYGISSIWNEFDVKTVTKAALYQALGSLCSRLNHVLRNIGGDDTGCQSTLIQEAPVAVRLLTDLTCDWITTLKELVERAKADQREIARAFFTADPATILPITELTLGISDPHENGNSVAFLKFGTRWRLVYKPRNVQIEEAFARFTSSLMSLHPPSFLKAPTVLSKGGYGWQEYIPYECINDPKDALLFFRRFGALLCLLRLLNATDCHAENVVAYGAQPVLVDAEGLLHPDSEITEERRRPRSELDAGAAKLLLSRSVTRVDFLPNPSGPDWIMRHHDYSALSGPRVDGKQIDRRLCKNLPLLGDRKVDFFEHVDSVVQGFSDFYDFLSERREDLLKQGGRLELFKDVSTRYFIRSTSRYLRIQDSALGPMALGDGLRRSIILDSISRAYLIPEILEEYKLIAEAELAALEKLDVPRFYVRATGRTIFDRSSDLTNMFNTCPFDQMRFQWERMSVADKELQVRIIRATALTGKFGVAARALVPHAVALCAGNKPNKGAPDALRLADRSPRVGLAKLAELFANHLVGKAISVDGNDGIWLGCQSIHEGRHVIFGATPLCYYEGLAGIAVAFASFGKATGAQSWQACAEKIITPVLGQVRQPSVGVWETRQESGDDGFRGLPGLIYALSRVAESSSLIKFKKDCVQAIDILAQGYRPSVTAATGMNIDRSLVGSCLALSAALAMSGRPTIRSAIERLPKDLCDVDCRSRALTQLAYYRLAAICGRNYNLQLSQVQILDSADAVAAASLGVRYVEESTRWKPSGDGTLDGGWLADADALIERALTETHLFSIRKQICRSISASLPEWLTAASLAPGLFNGASGVLYILARAIAPREVPCAFTCAVSTNLPPLPCVSETSE